MEEMGMTDKQFAGFLRFVIADLLRAIDAEDKETSDKILSETIEKLQKAIED